MLFYYDEARYEKFLEKFFQEIDKERINRNSSSFMKFYRIMIKVILEVYKEK